MDQISAALNRVLKRHGVAPSIFYLDMYKELEAIAADGKDGDPPEEAAKEITKEEIQK